MSIENAASVWIFGSLLNNSQLLLAEKSWGLDTSWPNSDGTRNFAQGGK